MGVTASTVVAVSGVATSIRLDLAMLARFVYATVWLVLSNALVPDVWFRGVGVVFLSLEMQRHLKQNE